MFSWFITLITSDMWVDSRDGIRMVGLGFGLIMMILGLVPALTLKEKTKSFVEKQERVPVLKSMKFAFASKPFVYLVLAFFAALFAYNTVATAYIYPLRYISCLADGELFGKWNGMIESIHHVSTLLMLWPISVLSKKLGKKAICLLAPLFLVIGSIAFVFSFVAGMPWLVLIPRFLVAIGLAGLFSLIPSMIADVVDYDELRTGTRREGMFGAIFSWMLKLALASALLINGYILDGLGVDNALGMNQPEGALDTIVNLLGILPVIGAAIAFYFIYQYSLNDNRMVEIRAELEERRGVS